MSKLITDLSNAGGVALDAQMKAMASKENDKEIASMIKASEFMAAYDEENNLDIKDSSKKKIVANGYNVIFTKYERNPYRYKVKSNSLITTGIEDYRYHRSDDTGELERDTLGIICCNVVAVGPECKYVKEGDDIYIRAVGLAPVPFDGQGYWAINEQNVICRIVDKDGRG